MDYIFEKFGEFVAFEKWAFNKNGFIYDTLTRHTWNSLHGDLFFVQDDEEVEASLNKMAEVWVAQGRPGYGAD